jgi:hypothetical protein
MTIPLPRGARAAAGLRRAWLPTTVALLAAGLAAALAVALWAVLTTPPAAAAPKAWPDDSTRAALGAARQCGVRIFTVRSASVDRDLDAVAGCATGRYAQDIARARPALRKAVLDTRSQSSARVVEAAVTGTGRAPAPEGRRVTALLAIDVSVRSAARPAAQTQRHRIRAEMAKVGDRWLIARLQLV